MCQQEGWWVGTDEEVEVKSEQSTSQSKDKKLLGEIKAGAIRQWRQQRSWYKTVVDRKGGWPRSHQAE